MDIWKQLTSDTIAAIFSLKARDKQVKETSGQILVSNCAVKRYVACWREGGCSATLTKKKKPGVPQKTSKHAVKVVERIFLKFSSLHPEINLRSCEAYQITFSGLLWHCSLLPFSALCTVLQCNHSVKSGQLFSYPQPTDQWLLD